MGRGVFKLIKKLKKLKLSLCSLVKLHFCFEIIPMKHSFCGDVYIKIFLTYRGANMTVNNNARKRREKVVREKGGYLPNSNPFLFGSGHPRLEF